MYVSPVLCLIGPQDTRHSSTIHYHMSNIFVRNEESLEDFLKPIFWNLISQVDRHAIKIFEYFTEHIVLFTKKKNLKNIVNNSIHQMTMIS